MSAFDDILGTYLNVKYAQPIRRYICPECAYPIEDTDKGLHCRNCGWKENPTIRFIPRTPENPQN